MKNHSDLKCFYNNHLEYSKGSRVINRLPSNINPSNQTRNPYLDNVKELPKISLYKEQYSASSEYAKREKVKID